MRMRGKLPIFSKRDCGNMNDVLLNVIYHGVKAFRDSERKSYPPEFNSMEEWNEILDFIVTRLENKEEPRYKGSWDKSSFPWRATDDDKWKAYVEEFYQWYMDRQLAMELFGKYCLAMWD